MAIQEVRGHGLLHFVRNDEEWVSSLRGAQRRGNPWGCLIELISQAEHDQLALLLKQGQVGVLLKIFVAQARFPFAADGLAQAQLTRQAIAAGCPSIVPAHAKIIERLADAGFFQAGGILVGTHVYMAYQNYLGVRWQSAAQTVDLDFAHAGRNVPVAIPSDVTMDMGSEIEALKMGFVPVKSLTTYVKSDEQDLQIDFVTCRHRGGDTPVLIKALNATMRVKATKDLDQAASLIEYLANNDSELLSET